MSSGPKRFMPNYTVADYLIVDPIELKLEVFRLTNQILVAVPESNSYQLDLHSLGSLKLDTDDLFER